jgi:hypothetical protein
VASILGAADLQEEAEAEELGEEAGDVCRLTGRLIDPWQRPLGGMQVKIYSHRGWPRAVKAKPSPSSSESRGFETVTDGEGRFLFEFPPPPVGATLSTGGDPLMSRLVLQFAAQPAGLPATNTTLYLPVLTAGERDLGDWVLVSAGALEGRVTDREGRPLEGVSLSSADGAGSSLGQYCQSAADGSFVLGGITHSPVWIRARADGHHPVLEGPFETLPGQIRGGIEVSLEIGPRLSGRVVNPACEPLIGAMVDLFPRRGEGFVVRTRSGEEGRFEVGLQSSDGYQLMAHQLGYIPIQFSALRFVEPGADLTVMLEPLPTTVFLVEDAQSSRAIEEFHLEVRSGGRGWFGAGRSAPSAPQRFPKHPGGRLELAACLEDTVWVFAPGYAQTELPVAWEDPGTRLCRLRLTPAARILGQLAAAGESVAGAALWLRSADGAQGREIRSSADGRFAFDDLPAGTYDLEAVSGLSQVRRGAIQVAEGQTLDLGRLELEPAGSLRVRLIPPPGQSAAGLRLRLDDALGGPALLTDGLGVARFTGLAQGPHRLFFGGAPQRFEPAPPVEALIRAGQETELALDLAPLEWCRIEVQMTAPRLGTATVELLGWNLAPELNPAVDDRPNFLLIPRARPDAAGRWIGHAPPGAKGQLCAEVRSAPSWRWDGPKVNTTPGEIVSADFPLPAAELLLSWEEAADWPTDLRISLSLEPLETQASIGYALDVPSTISGPFVAGPFPFDQRRPRPLEGPAADLLRPGELCWSALPPGRFRARVQLQAAEGDALLRSFEAELTLPENGQAECTLR